MGILQMTLMLDQSDHLLSAAWIHGDDDRCVHLEGWGGTDEIHRNPGPFIVFDTHSLPIRYPYATHTLPYATHTF